MEDRAWSIPMKRKPLLGDEACARSGVLILLAEEVSFDQAQDVRQVNFEIVVTRYSLEFAGLGRPGGRM